MADPPPSPSGSSTAVPASPLRTQRGQRLERGPSGALLLPISTSGSPSQQPARGPSRGKWLLLQACFLLLLLASAALLFTESRRTAWVSQLLQRNTNSTALPAFQVNSTLQFFILHIPARGHMPLQMSAIRQRELLVACLPLLEMEAIEFGASEPDVQVMIGTHQ